MPWQFWIDRGGTFTDVVGRRDDGSLATLKLLSEDPARYRDAAVEGMRRLLRLAPGAPITPELVDCVRMGTTVATNALLERNGEPTVLVITEGFRDALRIAYQERPRIFDRHIVLPELLYERVIEAHERVGADGEVVARARRASISAASWRAPPPTASAVPRSCSCTGIGSAPTSSPRPRSRAPPASSR